MIHLYHGDGKGKTTAATGLALRAAGSGMRVLFTQFFKDGSSSELKSLSQVSGITIVYPELCLGSYVTMGEKEKAEMSGYYHCLLHETLQKAADYDLIVLDEIVSTYGYNMVDRNELLEFLKAEGHNKEIVLTGRHPAPELVELADYVTEMKKEKHPFDKGIVARKGIEY